jgi:hypothetical protein
MHGMMPKSDECKYHIAVNSFLLSQLQKYNYDACHEGQKFLPFRVPASQ